MAAGVKILVGLWILFVVFTILSTIMDGAAYFMSGTQSEAIDYLTSFSLVGQSWYALPVVAWNFFVHGLPAMIAWDYAWLDALGSAGEMMRLILRGATGILIAWSIVVWVIPGLVHLMANIAGGVTSIFRR
jgi:hypothetical protein